MRWTAVVLAFAACCPAPDSCDGVVAGACVYFDKPHPDLAYDLFRVEETAAKGLAYWGAPPDALAGWTIWVRGAEFVSCEAQSASGCCHGHCALIELASGGWCFEWSISHEIGHAVIGDDGHTDPRWEDVPRFCVLPDLH